MRMVSRRRFLFILGGATTGIWLAPTGLVRFERTFLLTVAGSCSFCGKSGADVIALVGTSGRSARICDECVGLCCDIVAEESARSLLPSDVFEAFRLASERRTAEYDRRAAAKHEAFLRLPEAERQAILLAQQRATEESRKEFQRVMEALKREDQERSLLGISRVVPPPQPKPEFACSFCDRPKHEVARLISGARVFICDTCVGEAGGAMLHLLRT
jgi:hypothetical protein